MGHLSSKDRRDFTSRWVIAALLHLHSLQQLCEEGTIIVPTLGETEAPRVTPNPTAWGGGPLTQSLPS